MLRGVAIAKLGGISLGRLRGEGEVQGFFHVFLVFAQV